MSSIPYRNSHGTVYRSCDYEEMTFACRNNTIYIHSLCCHSATCQNACTLVQLLTLDTRMCSEVMVLALCVYMYIRVCLSVCLFVCLCVSVCYHSSRECRYVVYSYCAPCVSVGTSHACFNTHRRIYMESNVGMHDYAMSIVSHIIYEAREHTCGIYYYSARFHVTYKILYPMLCVSGTLTRPSYSGVMCSGRT